MGPETRDKWWCIHEIELYIAIKTHELEVHATMGNESHKQNDKENKLDTKESSEYDYIYRKCHKRQISNAGSLDSGYL